MTIGSFICAAVFIIVGAAMVYVNIKNVLVDISEYRRWPEYRRYKITDGFGHSFLAILGASLVALGAWIPSSYQDGQERYDRFERSCTELGGTVVNPEDDPYACWQNKIELEY